MKMKHILLTTLMMVCTVCAYADAVAKTDAKVNALAFVTSRINDGLRTAPTGGIQETNLTLAVADESYYAFNIGSDEGFVLVSASDNTQTILGYSDTGSFDYDNAPDALKAWLATLSSTIKKVEAGELSATTSVATTASSTSSTTLSKTRSVTKNVIPTLVTSQWNQGDPYNADCPVYDSSGSIAVTGCVATAMAQVMYYWKWPQDETGTIPSYSTSWTGTTVTYDALEPTTFNWDAMTDTYDDDSSDESKAAVAELMHYVGKSLQMGYGSSSGASATMTVTALTSYYGYDVNMYYASSDDYDYESWQDLIYTELAAGRPLLMNGDTSDRTGGHEWVCDGYDGNGLFHMNWGWGGYCDGYFILTVMYPDQQGIGGSTSSDGYSMGQGIVVGLQPAEDEQEETEETVRISLSDLRLSSTTYTRKKLTSNFYFPVTYSAGTNLSNSYYFDSCFTLYDEDGNIVKEQIGIEKNFLISPGTYWPSRSCYVTFGSNIEEGTYYIKGRSRENGTEDWNLDDGFYKNYIKAEITDTFNLALTIYPATNLTVNSIELVGIVAEDTELKIKANITNNDDVEYYHDTYLLVDGSWVSGNCIVVPANATDDYYFKYTPTEMGDHVLSLSTSKDTDDVFHSETVTFTASSTPVLSVSMKCLSNKTGSIVYGNCMRLSVTVKNKGTEAYTSYVEASPWEIEGSYYWKRSASQQEIDLDAGCDTTLVFVFNDLDYDGTYNFHTDTNGGSSANLGDFTFKEGIRYWLADGTQDGAAKSSSFTIDSSMVAVELPGSKLPSFSVSSDVNPNIILYVDEGVTINSRISTLLANYGVNNIIYGGEGDNVVINDSLDFYVPVSFTAANTTYTRSVGDVSEEGWTTLALPFAPTTVTADDESIDWFHSDSDTGKDFIIKEFTEVEDNYVYFSYVDELSSNRPYLVAFAGEKDGETFDLSGKTLTFSATDATFDVVERLSTYSTDYKYLGQTAATDIDDAYILNPDGTVFEKVEGTTTISPFRACFVANNDLAALDTQLIIGDGDTTTAIDVVDTDDSMFTEGTEIYTIGGVKAGVYTNAGSLNALPHGVYIIEGQKVVR